MRTLVAAILFLATSAFAQSTFTVKRVTINDLAFLSGCWALERQERKMRIEEQWMSPSGGTMIGVSKTVKDGKTTGWEYMRIEERDNGIFFVSKPRENKDEVDFGFVISEFAAPPSGPRAVFENPQHDFPQRVIYRSDKRDTLDARIEGSQNGKRSGVDFRYTRVSCN